MTQLFTIFITVLIAEIGDKTQLSTMLFATDRTVGRLSVFIAAAAALVTATALAVIAGSVIERYVPAATLRIAAGIGFIAVGIWTLISAS